MTRIFSLFAFLFYLIEIATAQTLKPGFDAEEYGDLMALIDYQNRVFDESGKKTFVIPDGYILSYSSPEMGFKNQWDFWKRNDGTGIIVLRGTINNATSWLANFYAAMIPASGSLHLNDSTVFNYKLASDEKAAVHVGWTTALAHLAPSIKEKLLQAYSDGTRSFLICGHSQGGALAFLTRSYLEYAPGIPRDIQFKTYCSAAPKAGNIYYACDFDFISRGYWSHRIVNNADWVPETPITIQTVSDMNEVNPFMNIDKALKKQPWLVRVFLRSKYRKLDRATVKAEKRYRKTLGHLLFGRVKKVLPQFREPVYAKTMQYMTAGNPVILQNDSAYFRKHPFDGKNIFLHHLPTPYLELVDQYFPGSK